MSLEWCTHNFHTRDTGSIMYVCIRVSTEDRVWSPKEREISKLRDFPFETSLGMRISINLHQSPSIYGVHFVRCPLLDSSASSLPRWLYACSLRASTMLSTKHPKPRTPARVMVASYGRRNSYWCWAGATLVHRLVLLHRPRIE